MIGSKNKKFAPLALVIVLLLGITPTIADADYHKWVITNFFVCNNQTDNYGKQASFDLYPHNSNLNNPTISRFIVKVQENKKTVAIKEIEAKQGHIIIPLAGYCTRNSTIPNNYSVEITEKDSGKNIFTGAYRRYSPICNLSVPEKITILGIGVENHAKKGYLGTQVEQSITGWFKNTGQYTFCGNITIKVVCPESAYTITRRTVISPGKVKGLRIMKAPAEDWKVPLEKVNATQYL